MGRLNTIFSESFWIYSIVAVVFLAPSSGLITLTIPDEPYGNYAGGLPDAPHIAKRASDDAAHLAIDATPAFYRIGPSPMRTGTTRFLLGEMAVLTRSNNHAIRGPPETVRA